jgi:hypothetical protein
MEGFSLCSVVYIRKRLLKEAVQSCLCIQIQLFEQGIDLAQ